MSAFPPKADIAPSAARLRVAAIPVCDSWVGNETSRIHQSGRLFNVEYLAAYRTRATTNVAGSGTVRSLSLE
jgi:hypothetical protein